MALKWVDGFEHYGTDKNLMIAGVGGGAAWSQVSAQWNLSTVNPATGTYHLRLTATNNVAAPKVRRIWGVASQVVGLGYRFNVADLPSDEGGVNSSLVVTDIHDASNVRHCTVVMGTDGSVFAKRGVDLDGGAIGGTLLGRSDPCIAAGGYHHYEAKFKIDNTVGYIEIRVNEVTVLNLTGIDTQNTANASAGQFTIQQSGNAAQPHPGFGTYDVDDIFAWDDDASDAENTIVDFVGDKGCYYLKPNADTATAGFIINGSATSYGAIDDAAPNGTDYLDTAASTARTIVGVESLPGNVSEVIAMVPVIYARKEESGTVSLRGGVVVDGEEFYTPTNSPSTEYAYMEPGPKTIDPSTGVAWANDAEPELLIERTA